MSSLLTHSYVLGLKDALSDREQLLEFVASVGRTEYDALVSVPLDEVKPLRIPPGAPLPALDLTYGANPIARVAALAPGEDWNWDAVTERVVSRALYPLQETATFEEVLDLLRPGPRDDSDRRSSSVAPAAPL